VPQQHVEREYRVSERVVLRPGDRFRVSGGPYYRAADGGRYLMGVRGVIKFRQAVRRGRRVLIEGFDAHGCAVVLHVAGRRRSPVPGLVPRPYRVTGRVRSAS
jgi:hypothetical protein